MQRSTTPPFRIVLEAEQEIAFDSPDHLMPWGTKRDNSRNPRFNQKLYKIFSEQKDQLKVLDLGCSGGGFVKDCSDDNCLAVGLEGSDYSKRHARAEWRTIPEFLFTCDVTHNFQLFLERDSSKEPIKFDVVTAWELIEHIATDDLPRVAENVKKHLAPHGLWIMSVSPNEEIIDGVKLHQSVYPREWWLKRFNELGFRHLEEFVHYFSTQYIRGPKYGAPRSFHLVLTPDQPNSPRVPAKKLSDHFYDHWYGSRAHRFLKKLILG